MAAGAGAGGANIIIIIIVVLLRRKRSSEPQKKPDERTVVAFENPMYDDPKTNSASSQPMYGGGLAPEHEGLYDEPSFAAKAKHNPLYNSNENLAAAGGANYLDGGGAGTSYLETSPNAGYLDVSPQGRNSMAEDVGYLGAEQQPAATEYSDGGGFGFGAEPQYDMAAPSGSATYASADVPAAEYQAVDYGMVE